MTADQIQKNVYEIITKYEERQLCGSAGRLKTMSTVLHELHI